MITKSNRPFATTTRSLQVILCTGGLLLGTDLSFAQGNSLRAGVARIEITPSRPVRLAGYESRKELSRGVHDPLSARAMAFSQDRQRLVLVSIDNLGFYNETAGPLRKAILDECGLKPSELFLCAIHTHSAPTLILNSERGHSNNVEYSKWLQGKLVEVARSALDGLTPVQVGVGIGAAPVGSNRREVVQDSNGANKIVLGRNPSLPIDREVQVLKLAQLGRDEPAGVLFAYCTHSTSLGPGNYLISGDVHGLAEQFVEKYFGAEVVAPGLAGASGDIDPWFRVLPGFNTTNGWIPEPILMGTMLGEEVVRVQSGIRKWSANGPVRTAIQTLQLPRKASKDAESNAVESPASFVMTVGRVGEVAFVGLGGEVFNEIGLAIKKASPFPCTFVFTHCNGAAGYVPTRSSYAEGGYEVQSSPFAPGADSRLVEEAQKMLAQLR